MSIATGRHKGATISPFRGIRDLISDMNRIADTMASVRSGPTGDAVHPWRPATDIVACGTDVLIRCDVPGVLPEDIQVTFSPGHLSITGVRRPGRDRDTAAYGEDRTSGAFRREITLPTSVVRRDVWAELDQGLLQVTVNDAARPTKEVVIPVNEVTTVPAPRPPQASSQPEAPVDAGTSARGAEPTGGIAPIGSG